MKRDPSPTENRPAHPLAERGTWIGLGLLIVASVIVYAPVGDHGFVTYDDPEYIEDNPHVNGGLTLSGIGWAFTAFHSSNWHPLTWLSHMLDCELFGLDAGKHHAMAVVWHALNACLLFLLLLQARRARDDTFPAFFVAALFALHPLRVESVAWASERKDLLSAFFLFLLLMEYGRYVRTGSRRAWIASIVLYACGLASKPMLVSVPVLLWMVERWPLRRGAPAASPARPGDEPGDGPTGGPPGDTSWFENLHVRDKLPFLLLSAASVVLTLLSQSAGGALRSIESLPLDARLSNAVIATATYLGKSLVPAGLAYFHPHPALSEAATYTPWSPSFFASAALVLGLCVLAVRVRKRLPAFTFGWFAYLLLLTPVSGLVQVGEQAWAERYAYLPLIGIYIAIVFPLADRLRPRASWRRALVGLALLTLPILGWRARSHLKTWESSTRLYRNALEVTRNNYAAHHLLGNLSADQGGLQSGERHYRAALAIRPDYGPSHYGLGLLSQDAGELEAAIVWYREALEHDPNLAQAWLNLGSALAASWQSGPPRARTSERLMEARAAFEKVLELVPDQPEALLNLGGLCLMAGEPEAAVQYLEQLNRVRADAMSYGMLATAYEQAGRHTEAEQARARAARAENRP